MSSPLPSSAAAALLGRIRSELGAWGDGAADVDPPPHPVPLPSRLAVADLAWASVGAVCQIAGLRRQPDPDRIALSYRSDRHLSINGVTPSVWSPYSGFWRASDGWLRTHGNYPHHAAALLDGLRLPGSVGADTVREAIAERPAAEAVTAIVSAGGLAVRVLPENPSRDATLRDGPLLDVRHTPACTSRLLPAASVGRRPLAGIRALDLTRVIAGPVCTRTLALLGADVLRIDPPHLEEPEWQHLDTGHGKRSALLDARTAPIHELLRVADVVVLGYRPESLARLGLSPDLLAERHPGLVIAQLSAWGLDQPRRAGFDSLVQAESGIALVESPDGDLPGVLPAQALDHSAGYLLAASVIALLDRRRREGGTWQVNTSLRRLAAELLGMPRTERPEAEHPIDAATHLASFEVDGRALTTVRSVVPGLELDPPHAWGSDQPVW